MESFATDDTKNWVFVGSVLLKIQQEFAPWVQHILKVQHTEWVKHVQVLLPNSTVTTATATEGAGASPPMACVSVDCKSVSCCVKGDSKAYHARDCMCAIVWSEIKKLRSSTQSSLRRSNLIVKQTDLQDLPSEPQRYHSTHFLVEPWSVAVLFMNALGNRASLMQDAKQADASKIDFQNLQHLVARNKWFRQIYGPSSDSDSDSDSETDSASESESDVAYEQLLEYASCLNTIRNNKWGHCTPATLGNLTQDDRTEAFGLMKNILLLLRREDGSAWKSPDTIDTELNQWLNDYENGENDVIEWQQWFTKKDGRIDRMKSMHQEMLESLLEDGTQTRTWVKQQQTAVHKHLDSISAKLRTVLESVANMHSDVKAIAHSVLLDPDIKRQTEVAKLIADIRERQKDVTQFMPEHIQSQHGAFVPLSASLTKIHGAAEFSAQKTLAKYAQGEKRCRALLDHAELEAHAIDDNEISVLFLQGIAGSGKSLTAWHVWHSIVTSYDAKNDNPIIPLVISLPEFKDDALNGTLLTAYFRRYFESHFTTDRSLHDILTLLKRHARFLLILDGLDELGDKTTNIYVKNELASWHGPVWISCRSGFLSDEEIGRLIAPRTANRPQEYQVLKLHLQPFDDGQRKHYIREFVRKRFNTRRANEIDRLQEHYFDMLGRFPSLVESTRNPLTLFMFLDILPELTGNQGLAVSGHEAATAAAAAAIVADAPAASAIPANSQATLRLDTDRLKVVEQKQDPERDGPSNRIFKLVRRSELYAIFLHKWLKCQVAKTDADRTAAESKALYRDALKLSERVAFEMFLLGTTQFEDKQAAQHLDDDSDTSYSDTDSDVEPDSGSGSGSHSDSEVVHPQSQLPRAELAKLFQCPKDDLRVSPIIQTGSVYSFLHKSIQEFLAAMYILKQLSKRVKGSKWARDINNPVMFEYEIGNENRFRIARKSLLDDVAVLTFAADMISRRGVTLQRYQAAWPVSSFKKSGLDFQPVVKSLFDIVESLKHNDTPHVRVAAGNAITILNFARVSFSCLDLRNLNFSPDVKQPSPPIANLAGAHMSHSQLQLSNLSQVPMMNATLDGADVAGCNLNATDFGALPWLSHKYGAVECMAYSPRLGLFFSSGKLDIHLDNTRSYECAQSRDIRIWDMHSPLDHPGGRCLALLRKHCDNVQSLFVIPAAADAPADGDLAIRLFSCSIDGMVCCWEVVRTHADATIRCSLLWSATKKYNKFTCLTVADSRIVFVGTRNKESIQCLDAKTGEWLDDCSALMTVRSASTVRAMFVAEYDSHDGDSRKLLFAGNGAYVDIWRFSFTQTRMDIELALRLDHGQGKGTVYSMVMHEFRGVQTLVVGCSSKWEPHAPIVLWKFADILNICAQHSPTKTFGMNHSPLYIRTLQGHNSSVDALYVSANDPPVLYSGGADNIVRVWDADLLQCIHMYHGHTSTVAALMELNGEYLLSGAKDSTIRIWNVGQMHQTQQHLMPYQFRWSMICCVCERLGCIFVGVGWDIIQLDLQTGQILHVMPPMVAGGRRHWVFGLEIVESDHEFALYSADAFRRVTRWDLNVEPAKPVQVQTGLQTEEGGEYAFCIDATGTFVYVGESSGEVGVSPLALDASMNRPRPFHFGATRIKCDRKACRVRGAQADTRLRSFAKGSIAGHNILFTGSHDFHARVWIVDDIHKPVCVAIGCTAEWVLSLHFDQVHHLLLASCGDSKVYAWHLMYNAETSIESSFNLRRIAVLCPPQNAGYARTVTIIDAGNDDSKNSLMVACGFDSGLICTWVADSKLERVQAPICLYGHTDRVTCIRSYSTPVCTIISTDWSGAIFFWRYQSSHGTWVSMFNSKPTLSACGIKHLSIDDTKHTDSDSVPPADMQDDNRLLLSLCDRKIRRVDGDSTQQKRRSPAIPVYPQESTLVQIRIDRTLKMHSDTQILEKLRTGWDSCLFGSMRATVQFPLVFCGVQRQLDMFDFERIRRVMIDLGICRRNETGAVSLGALCMHVESRRGCRDGKRCRFAHAADFR
jgi:WD40 repeat protein